MESLINHNVRLTRSAQWIHNFQLCNILHLQFFLGKIMPVVPALTKVKFVMMETNYEAK